MFDDENEIVNPITTRNRTCPSRTVLLREWRRYAKDTRRRHQLEHYLYHPIFKLMRERERERESYAMEFQKYTYKKNGARSHI